MAIYLASPEPSDALREARAWFADFDQRVLNQRVFEAVKHVQQVTVTNSELPRFIKGETIREGGQK